MYDMASLTLAKLCSLHTIAIIFAIVSSQIPVSSGHMSSVLRGEMINKNPNYDPVTHNGHSLSQGKSDGKGTGESGNGEMDAGQPTYIPFLSSRALSNIPEFFQQLRANLEALQQDEGIEREGEDAMISGGDFGEAEEQVTKENDDGKIEPYAGRLLSSQQYLPGSNGRFTNVLSFVRQPTGQENYLRRAHNYNPSWLYTNLGLGRRRRGR